MRQSIVAIALAITLAACGPAPPEGPVGNYLRSQVAAIDRASEMLEAAHDERSAQLAANEILRAFITQTPSQAEWRKLSQTDRAALETYRTDVLTPAMLRMMKGMYRVIAKYPKAAKHLEREFRTKNDAAAARFRAQMADGMK